MNFYGVVILRSKHVMEKNDKILVAGAKGLLGSAAVRRLRELGFVNILEPSHSELDYTDKAAVDRYFAENKPDYVFMIAAKVGGIQANRTALDQFLYLNTMMEFNTIMAAYENGVKKFCFVGSGCIYPRESPQPIREDYLLTGPLEQTNEGYAIAKIAGLKLCEYLNTHHPERADFISVMPCNLYGPGDSYDPEHSHVIPALIRKFHEAKETGKDTVEMWGTGTAMREFMYIDDLADAIVFLMQNYSGDRGEPEGTPGMSWVNIGYGEDIVMSEVGKIVAETVGFTGNIVFDHIHPDGTPKKLLDSSKLFSLGWKPSVSFREGIRRTYEDYKINKDNYRK